MQRQDWLVEKAPPMRRHERRLQRYGPGLRRHDWQAVQGRMQHAPTRALPRMAGEVLLQRIARLHGLREMCMCLERHPLRRQHRPSSLRM